MLFKIAMMPLPGGLRGFDVANADHVRGCHDPGNPRPLLPRGWTRAARWPAIETFYAIDKARELVGFTPRHSWRDVLSNP